MKDIIVGCGESVKLREVSVVLTFMLLTMVLAGTGCTDMGSPAGMGGGDPVAIDTVFFSRDVLPIFLHNCAAVGCHNASLPAEGLDLSSWQSLMQGSNNGAVVAPGNAANSVLVSQIEEGPARRMPLDGPPYLTNEEICLIRDWIDQGGFEN